MHERQNQEGGALRFQRLACEQAGCWGRRPTVTRIEPSLDATASGKHQPWLFFNASLGRCPKLPSPGHLGSALAL